MTATTILPRTFIGSLIREPDRKRDAEPFEMVREVVRLVALLKSGLVTRTHRSTTLCTWDAANRVLRLVEPGSIDVNAPCVSMVAGGS